MVGTKWYGAAILGLAIGCTGWGPRVPGWVGGESGWLAALEWWDGSRAIEAGVGAGTPRERARARDRALRRLEGRVMARSGLAGGRWAWVRDHLAREEVLCEHWGLIFPGPRSDEVLRPGVARVALFVCEGGCAEVSGGVQVVWDPGYMREVDDAMPDMVLGHGGSEHRRDLPGVRSAHAGMVPTLGRVEVVEVIGPGDRRYRNRMGWARCRWGGREVYVHAYGLLNCEH